MRRYVFLTLSSSAISPRSSPESALKNAGLGCTGGLGWYKSSAGGAMPCLRIDTRSLEACTRTLGGVH